MSIRTLASFIVLTMSRIQCWPNMSNIEALYTNKGMINDFEEVEKLEGLKQLTIGFKTYHYLSVVTVKLSFGRANVYGGIIGQRRYFFDSINSTSFKVKGLGGYQFLTLSIQANFDNMTMTDLAIDGYETKLYKYVGCFKMTNFTEPVEIFMDCELHCAGTPFYGFNEEELCVCIESLPKVDSPLHLCKLCQKKVGIICGFHESAISVYSKNSVQKIVEMDPKLFEDCALYGNHCPTCTIGRGDYMCQRIDCYNDFLCGNILCYKDIVMNQAYFELCLCAVGLYIDDDLVCHDIDECIEDEVCKERNRTCENTYRSYKCNCDAGLRAVDDIICEDIDECQNETICDIYTTTCQNLYRDYECVCLDGYVRVDPKFRKNSCEESPTGCPWKLIILIILSILGAAIIWYYRKKNDALPTT